DEKSGSRDGDEQGNPGIAEREGEPGCAPQGNKWQSRDDELSDTAGMVRLPVTAEDLCPATWLRDRSAGIGRIAHGDGGAPRSAILRVSRDRTCRIGRSGTASRITQRATWEAVDISPQACRRACRRQR